MEYTIGLFYGIVIGAAVALTVTVAFIFPMSQTNQFRKDCRVMVHARVTDDADNLCVKNGKILFHK